MAPRRKQQVQSPLSKPSRVQTVLAIIKGDEGRPSPRKAVARQPDRLPAVNHPSGQEVLGEDRRGQGNAVQALGRRHRPFALPAQAAERRPVRAPATGRGAKVVQRSPLRRQTFVRAAPHQTGPAQPRQRENPQSPLPARAGAEVPTNTVERGQSSTNSEGARGETYRIAEGVGQKFGRLQASPEVQRVCEKPLWL